MRTVWQYLNKEKEEFEEVQPENWVWGVVYDDNSELHQFADDGIFHRFSEIEQNRVKLFVMYRFGDLTRRIDMPIADPESTQIFHFYRNFMFDVGTEAEKKVKVYVFGWKKMIKKHIKGNLFFEEEVATYHYILPDNRIITSDQDVQKLSSFNL